MANIPIEVIFRSTDKRTNSTKLVEGGEVIKCFLKDNNSIIEPELLIRKDNPSEIFDWNYFTIEEFNRSYFITDIISEDSRQWWVKGHVDLLGTYREEILNTDAFIMYSASHYNSMLPDDRLKLSDRSVVNTVEYELPYSSTTGCFIITIVTDNADGSTGPAETFVMSKADLMKLSEALNDTTWAAQIQKYFTGNPMDALISCTWVPFDYIQLSKEVKTVSPFGYPLMTALTVDKQINGSFTVDPYVPYYTEYYNPETREMDRGYAD